MSSTITAIFDRAVKALEDAGSVDIDERSSQWRQSGWDYPAADIASGAALGGFGAGAATVREATGYGSADHVATDRASGQEEVIPVVEEQLVVGKRDVSRGGVHVRSPVHEQIRLRNERVDVERRPVDREVSGADDVFRERTIDVIATGEEAVVGKNARVVEEVVVSKTADERVEQIDDTVRRTDVEIDRDAGTDLGSGSTSGIDRR